MVTSAKLSCTISKQRFTFASIKEVLAKANEEKAGDLLAGIAAHTELERIAAKSVLSELTPEALRNEPVVPYEDDAITRLIDDSIDGNAWGKVKNWTVAELREFILQAEISDIASIRLALTGEIAAAVTKLMSNLDLISAAKKCQVIATANSTLGATGVLGARLQPNHPADSTEGILASIYEGLSYGIGDAVIGINPVHDTSESVEQLLHLTDKVIDKFQIPTQNCILSHVTTQMQAIERGAPAGLIFKVLPAQKKATPHLVSR